MLAANALKTFKRIKLTSNYDSNNYDIYKFSKDFIASVMNNQCGNNIVVNYQKDGNGNDITEGNSSGWWFEFVIMNIYKIKFEISGSNSYYLFLADARDEYPTSKTTITLVSNSTISIQYYLIENLEENNDDNINYTLLMIGPGGASRFDGCLCIEYKIDENNSEYFYSNKFYASNTSSAKIELLLTNGLIRVEDRVIIDLVSLFNINTPNKIIYSDTFITNGYNYYRKLNNKFLSTSILTAGCHYTINNNDYFSLTTNLLLKI